jgi:two-component system sensor histidine kinase/response regulator
MRRVVVILIVFFQSFSVNAISDLDSLNFYYNKDDLKNAVRILERINIGQNDQQSKFNIYLKAIDIYTTAKEFEKAMKYYDLATEIIELNEDQKARLALSRAILAVKVGRVSEAEPYLNDLENYIKLNNTDSTFLMRYNLARVIYYDESGNYKDAMHYATNLLHYIERNKDYQRKASLYITIGEIFRHNNLLDKALLYYGRAEDIAKKNGYLGILGKIYNNQSIVFADRKDYETSLSKLEESVRIYTEVYGEESAAPALYNLGLQHLETGNPQNALKYFSKVLEIGKENDFSKAEFFGYFGLGLYYGHQKQVSDAKYYFLKALDIAKNNHNPADVGRTYEQLHLMYEENGDYQKSLEYFKLSNDLRDSLNMAENKMIIEGLEAKYRLSESQRENKTLKLKQTRQRLSFFIAGGVIIILLFVIILFYIGIRSKNRQNQLLSIQKDQIDAKNKELEKLNEAVSAQKSQLEEINNTKDAMFSIISHDLRSPLGSVYMLMNMMENDVFDKEQSASMVSDLTYEVHNTLFLLNNLMTWAHINIHELKANDEIIPLEEMLKDILNYFAKDIQRKNLNLGLSIDSSYELLEDKSMIELVLKNLISNAVKFSNESETVTISAERAENSIRIQITNKGVEIPVIKLKEIFKPGVRLQKGTKDERGVGLGLAICNTYMKVMEADMKFETEGAITKVTLLFKSGPF